MVWWCSVSWRESQVQARVLAQEMQAVLEKSVQMLGCVVVIQFARGSDGWVVGRWRAGRRVWVDSVLRCAVCSLLSFGTIYTGSHPSAGLHVNAKMLQEVACFEHGFEPRSKSKRVTVNLLTSN